MTQSTLSAFKADTRKFNELFKSVCDYFTRDGSSQHFIAIHVLIQNLGFDGKKCVNYSLGKEEAKCREILDILQGFRNHYDDYMTIWAYDELIMSWDGHRYSEDLPDF